MSRAARSTPSSTHRRLAQRLLPLAAAALAATLVGCAAVGPDHKAPVAALDDSFIAAGSRGFNSQAPAAEIASFWRSFGDTRLNALIEQALTANGDVRVAQARLQEARAGLDEADAAQRPGLALDTSAERSVRPLTQQPGASRAARTANSYDASFIAGWEIDLFGRLRRGSEQAAALAEAAATAWPPRRPRWPPKWRATTWNCAACSSASSSRRPACSASAKACA